MVLKRQRISEIPISYEAPLNMTDEVLNKIEEDQVLGKIKPVRKKTWQIRNLSVGIRSLGKKNNKK